MKQRVAEHGAASLIVVIFSVLLLMTVSLGFMRLVVTDQERTTDDELSRGAYDAAIAGVEDGKRVLQACLANGDTRACNAITSNECNTVQRARILSASHRDSDKGQILLQNSTGVNGGFDQAYTCVKVERDAADLEGTLNSDTSQVKMLQTTGAFTQLDISWFVRPPLGTDVELSLAPPTPLPAQNAWSSTATRVRPPILRVQLMQYRDGNFNLEDFDTDGGGHVLYLYPSNVGASVAAPLSFGSDVRRTGTGNLLQPVRCSTATTERYLCSVRVNVPAPVGGSAAERRAYLRITSIYGGTDYNIRAVGTQFHDVSPIIDSTGRAADVFRRVRARVELTSVLDTALYPRATVDITNNFCKDFSISANNYVAGTCRSNLP